MMNYNNIFELPLLKQLPNKYISTMENIYYEQ